MSARPDIRSAVLGLLADGRARTCHEIAAEIGLSYSGVYNRVVELTSHGRLARCGTVPTKTKPRDLYTRVDLAQPQLPFPTASERRRALHTAIERDNQERRAAKRAALTQRAEEMLRAYVHDDLPLRTIGERHGVTGERARQIMTALDPTLVALTLQRRHARARLRAYVNDPDSTVEVTHNCKLCGVVFTGTPSQRYCTREHREIHIALRYQIDPDFRAQQQVIMARQNQAKGIHLTYAANVLNGTVGEGPGSHGPVGWRWIIMDSKVGGYALDAYHNDWPIFERFHPEVQDQIRQYVAALEDKA